MQSNDDYIYTIKTGINHEWTRIDANGVLEAIALAVEQAGIERGFSPNLDWSHYRALMKVEHQNERLLN